MEISFNIDLIKLIDDSSYKLSDEEIIINNSKIKVSSSAKAIINQLSNPLISINHIEVNKLSNEDKISFNAALISNKMNYSKIIFCLFSCFRLNCTKSRNFNGQKLTSKNYNG